MAIKGDMNRQCVVYLVTNKVTGKRYIGVTSQSSVAIRMSQHFARARRGVGRGSFDRALRKYPREAFSWEIIERCDTVTIALLREVDLISTMRPEYNSTVGGDGARGHRMSAESKQRLSDFHRGRAWHSTPHSEQTKKRLSEIGVANREKWAPYAALGPRSLAKAVVCVADGSLHESIAAAARHYDVDSGTLTKVCQGKRRAVEGLVFHYAEEGA